MGEEGDDDLRSILVVLHKEQAEFENVSTLSLGDQSYIMDLANQQKYRGEYRKEEAMEDALDLYKAALEEGAPNSVGLFKTILAEVLAELNDEYIEKDRLQDEWLEAALQDELERQQEEMLSISNHEKTSSVDDTNHITDHGELPPHPPVPTALSPQPVLMRPPFMKRQSTVRTLDLAQKINDEDRNILEKKMRKAKKLIQEIVDEKGEEEAKKTRNYKRLKKKLKEYRTSLNKAVQEDMHNSKTNKSIMYDWGADQDVKEAEEEEVEDEQDSSSASEGDNESTDSRRSQFDDEDLEWAKNVVARLSLTPKASEEALVDADVAVEKIPKKRNPQKNKSNFTVMATRRGINAHDLLAERKANRRTLTTPKLGTQFEEKLAFESESPGAPTVDTHSQSTPFQLIPHAPETSPGKRKSPSWKTQAFSYSSTKQNDVDIMKAEICTPVLTETIESPAPASSDNNVSNLYTLKDFQTGKVSNVDSVEWETFLTPEEFKKHFGMSKDAFSKMPKWKRFDARRRLRTW